MNRCWELAQFSWDICMFLLDPRKTGSDRDVTLYMALLKLNLLHLLHLLLLLVQCLKYKEMEQNNWGMFEVLLSIYVQLII